MQNRVLIHIMRFAKQFETYEIDDVDIAIRFIQKYIDLYFICVYKFQGKLIEI